MAAQRAVVLLSGGLDSATALAIARPALRMTESIPTFDFRIPVPMMLNCAHFIAAGVTLLQRGGVRFFLMSTSFIFHLLEIQGLGATTAEPAQ